MKTTYTDQPSALLDKLAESVPRLKRKKMKPARNPLKAFCATLQQISNRTYRPPQDEFRSFCTMAATAVSNAMDVQHREERERRYLAEMNVQRYEDLEVRQLFPELFTHLVNGMEEKHRDFFAEVCLELELRGHKGLGQTWTPYEVSRATAKLTMLNAKERLQPYGYISICDPCVGTGVLAIAAAETLLEQGINPQTQAYFTAQDVDPHAVHMSYLQLSLYGLPARISLGDTLKNEQREHWFTPWHFKDGWGSRLSFDSALRSAQQLLFAGDDAGREPGEQPDNAVILANPPFGREWRSSQAAD